MPVNSDGALVFYPAINVGEPGSEKAMPIMLMIVVVFLFSMWDVYVPHLGLRVLDFAGVGLLCLWMLWKLAVDLRGPVFCTRGSHLLLLMLIWGLILSLVGFTVSMENAKPIAGILLGIVVFVCFYSIRLNGRSVAKVLGILIIIHASYLSIQYLYYQAFGVVLNIYGFLGTEPRALSSIFRPTGLFLEPASYSMSMLMLLTLRTLITKRFDTITYFAVGTIFLTLSLWGLIASIIFLLVFARKNTGFFIAVAVLVAFIALFSTVGWINANNTVDWINANDTPWARLMNLSEDGSATVRYGGLIGHGVDTIGSINLWFGKGISNEYHEFGSNGLAFILSAGGVFGTGAFLLLLFKSAPRNRGIVTLALILLFMTAAPIWTTLYWWLVLALMTRPLGEITRAAEP